MEEFSMRNTQMMLYNLTLYTDQEDAEITTYAYHLEASEPI